MAKRKGWCMVRVRHSTLAKLKAMMERLQLVAAKGTFCEWWVTDELTMDQMIARLADLYERSRQRKRLSAARRRMASRKPVDPVA